MSSSDDGMEDGTPEPTHPVYIAMDNNLALLAKLIAGQPGSDAEAVERSDAVDLAGDTASDIKALTTKLAGLITSEPWQPVAVEKALLDLHKALLDLSIAIEACDVDGYTSVMADELQFSCMALIEHLEDLISKVPFEGIRTKETGRDAYLVSSRRVTDSCQAVIDLGAVGLPGLLVKKAEEHKGLVDDALNELRKWGDEESDDDAEGDVKMEEPELPPSEVARLAKLREMSRIAKASGLWVVNANGQRVGSPGTDDSQEERDIISRHIPKDDPDGIRPMLNSTLKKGELILQMYQAVITRRLETVVGPSIYTIESDGPSHAHASNIRERMDGALEQLKTISEVFDELTCAFYELDKPRIKEQMGLITAAAHATVDLLLMDWEGQEDAFTSYVTKFKLLMKKAKATKRKPKA